MSFEKLETVKGTVSKLAGSVSYRRIRYKHDEPGDALKRLPRLVIGIPKLIWSSAPDADGQAFSFHIGRGDDAGRGRLIPDPDGIKARVVRGGATFMIGHVPAFGTDAAEKEFVTITVIPAVAASKGRAAAPLCFEISLPAWCKEV